MLILDTYIQFEEKLLLRKIKKGVIFHSSAIEAVRYSDQQSRAGGRSGGRSVRNSDSIVFSWVGGSLQI